MTRFLYTVKDKTGKTINGSLDAGNKEEVVEKLQTQNFFIVSISESSPSKSSGGRKLRKKPKKFSRTKIKLQDLLTFSRQLATMLEAGVPLVRSISVIQSQIESRNFHRVIEDVLRSVEQGAPLSNALSAHPKVFSQFWISLIEVGEASGTIPKTLDKLAFYLEQQASFRSTIISGIIYPAILFFVAVGAIAFFALVVGPKFQAIFESMGAELPWITRTLLFLFAFIKKNILFLIGGTVGAVIVFRRFIKTYNGRLMWEKFLFRLPTVGDVFKLIIVERFSAQMSLLVDSGVPILYALDITERLVDNNTCALIISDIKEAVKQGELLVAPMERSEFFPAMCVQMINVGEETGELSKMLKHVAAYYLEVVETFMKRFSTIIEPFMLVFMGAIIGTIVVSMFLPMFNLSQLGGGG